MPSPLTDETTWSNAEMPPTILKYVLLKTKHRLTFDIVYQAEKTRYRGDDDGDYFFFRASNRYEVISRSRMDIQTERIWLLGGQPHERSGSMIFSSDEKRDKAYSQFKLALTEWAAANSGKAEDVTTAWICSLVRE